MSYLEVLPAHLYLRVDFSSPIQVFDTTKPDWAPKLCAQTKEKLVYLHLIRHLIKVKHTQKVKLQTLYM